MASLVGSRVERKEDGRFITGKGRVELWQIGWLLRCLLLMIVRVVQLRKKVRFWATNCHDFFMVANRHNSRYSSRPYIWGNRPQCNGNRRVIPGRKMDSESKHENFGGHLGNYFDEINLRPGIRFMALGLVR